MRVSQYVYFSVFSEVSTAEEIGNYLGLPPDKVRIRGSRVADPPSPQAHSWQLVCDSPGLRLDEQASQDAGLTAEQGVYRAGRGACCRGEPA